MSKSRPKVKTVPPAYQRTPRHAGCAKEALVAALVEMVSVAVTAVGPVIVTGLVEPKMKVGESCPPLGPDVTAAVSDTLPVKPSPGVMVMVDVFPVVTPGGTVTIVPVIGTAHATRLIIVDCLVGVFGDWKI
jgi:hypothetical protein